MKKIILAFSLMLLVLTVSASAEEKVTVYAKDGRTASISASAVEEWKAVGWYEGVTMYTLDGRTAKISPFVVEDWKNVGWYTQPMAKMYAPDGRTVIIAKTAVDDYKKVGWFTEPVTLMYAADGRTKYVIKSQVEANKNVGWYTQPVTKMYAPSGKTIIIAKSAVEDYKKVGWYTEPVVQMWAYDGRSKYVVKSQVEANKKVGWYDNKADVMETVYAPDGRIKEVFKARVPAEKSIGWMDRTGYITYMSEFAKPFTAAYKSVVVYRNFNAEFNGAYALVCRKDDTVVAVETRNDSDYYGQERRLSNKYKGYFIRGFGQVDVGKTRYKSLDELYSYIGTYFSEDVYPHNGSYGFYVHSSGLYREKDFNYGYSANKDAVYLTSKGDTHYFGLTWAYCGFEQLDVFGISKKNGKYVITEKYSTDNQSDKHRIVGLLGDYYSSNNPNYLEMSKLEATILAIYLLEKDSLIYGGSSDYDVGSIYEMSIQKTKDNTYHLNTRTDESPVVGDISHTYRDFYFTVVNGMPTLTEYSFKEILRIY